MVEEWLRMKHKPLKCSSQEFDNKVVKLVEARNLVFSSKKRGDLQRLELDCTKSMYDFAHQWKCRNASYCCPILSLVIGMIFLPAEMVELSTVVGIEIPTLNLYRQTKNSIFFEREQLWPCMVI